MVRRTRLCGGRFDAALRLGRADEARGLELDLFVRLTQRGEVVFAVVVVGAAIARFLRAHHFVLVSLEHFPLNQLAAIRVDRMGDIGVELGAPLVVLDRPIFVELGAALVAVQGPQMILAMAARTAIGQLAAGHRDERALGPLDNFEITDHEAGIKSD